MRVIDTDSIYRQYRYRYFNLVNCSQGNWEGNQRIIYIWLWKRDSVYLSWNFISNMDIERK